MKNSSKVLLISLGGLILIALGVIFLPNSHGHMHSPYYNSSSIIIGDDKINSQSYSFANQPFDSIVLKVAGDITAQVTHKPHTANAIITTNSNLLPYIDVYVQNKTLCIAKRKHVEFNREKIKIVVNTEDLKSMSTYGSGDSIISNIDTAIFSSATYGSGDTLLQGKTKKLFIKISGSGDVNAKNLIAEDVEASIYGSGDITTNATKKISADIHGAGLIEYYGNPQKIHQSISGSGEIRSIEKF